MRFIPELDPTDHLRFDTFTKGLKVSQLLEGVPALSGRFELAVGCAAGVISEVEQPRVTLLPLLHSGVPTHFTVPLFEAQMGLDAQRLAH